MSPLLAVVGILLFLGVGLAGAHFQRQAIRRAGARSWSGWYASMFAQRDFSSYGWMMARVLPIAVVAALAFALVQAALG